MRARDRAQLGGTTQAGEAAEFSDVDPVGPASFGIGDVGEPFELGRHLGQVAVLRRRQRPFPVQSPRVSNRNEVLCHRPAPPVFLNR